MSFQRSTEAFPAGRLSATHYRAVHKHLFQDVYRWAGCYRSVRLNKDGSEFCLPQYIATQVTTLFTELRHHSHLAALAPDAFAEGAATFLANLNAIHPFREGNGRSQVGFLIILARDAGHPLDTTLLDREVWLDAMISSFHGDAAPLAEQIRVMI